MNGDKCPNCGTKNMPRYRPESCANARCCQHCQFVEEITDVLKALNNCLKETPK